MAAAYAWAAGRASQSPATQTIAHTFIVVGRGELLHDYITAQLQLGFEREHMDVL
jgi:hypothetical protein